MGERGASMRLMVAGLAAVTLGVGMGLVGCDRSGNQTVVIPRAPDSPAPSTQQEAEAAQTEIRRDLEPIPELGVAVAVKRADNEIWSKYPSGLMMYDIRPGAGIHPQIGQTVHVFYKGAFPDGTIFDQTKGDPFTFTLGTKQIIKGWNLALSTMGVGGKRKIYLPSSLAYGPGGNLPLIHPNQDLLFEIELLDVTGKMVEFPSTKPAESTTLPAAPAMGPATAPAAAPK